jgi:ABC-2 type transport system permease protein
MTASGEITRAGPRSSWAMRILAVLAKEFVQLTRDRLTYAMILMVPVMQLLLFGYAINTQPRHLPMAVLVQDDGTLARSTLAAFVNTGFFDVTHTARSPAELDELIRTGKVQFALTIPGDFSRRVARGDQAQVLLEADATDPSATSPAIAAAAGLPAAALVHDLKGGLAARAARPPPFEVVVHNRYNPEAITSHNIVPGLLGVILTLTLVLMTALSMTRERSSMTCFFHAPVARGPGFSCQTMLQPCTLPSVSSSGCAITSRSPSFTEQMPSGPISFATSLA